MTVFRVWYSMPGLLGSSRLRIAEWAPYSAGSMLTSSSRGEPFGSVIVDSSSENVPSLPTHERLYVVDPPPPEVRVKV